MSRISIQHTDNQVILEYESLEQIIKALNVLNEAYWTITEEQKRIEQAKRKA
jgi:hypothetical protein